MTCFRFLPEALTDLEEAAEWYEDQRPGLGTELLDEFTACLATAVETPGVGALSGITANGNEIRRYRLVRFRRYAILMTVIDHIPTVVALEHSSQRPRFWKIASSDSVPLNESVPMMRPRAFVESARDPVSSPA